MNVAISQESVEDILPVDCKDETIPSSALVCYDLKGFSKEAVSVASDGKENRLLLDQNFIQLIKLTITVKGDNNNIIIGRGSKIKNLSILIAGNNNLVVIGDRNNFDASKVQIAGNNCQTLFGARFRANSGCYFLAKEDGRRLHIGADSLFSNNIHVRTSDNHGMFDLVTHKRVNEAKDVTVGKRVWVGADACILKGSMVESDVVIGTKSVVTGKIPPFTVAAGVPARVVKTGVFWYKHLRLPKDYDPEAPVPWV